MLNTKLLFHTGARAVSTFFRAGPPVLSCTVGDDDNGGTLNCGPTVEESCDHSMDLGVVCGSVVRATLLPVTIETAVTTSKTNVDLQPTQFPPTSTVTCPPCDFDHCNMTCVNDTNSSPPSSESGNSQQDQLTDSSHIALFIVIAVLCILLLLGGIGWACTYIVLKRRLTASTSKR